VEIYHTTFEAKKKLVHGYTTAWAIYIEDGTLVIHDSAFDTNTADSVSG
jgi:hypothetical protein